MEQILYSIADHKMLSAIVGFILIVLETFAPILPLMAIVLANAFVLGMWMGFLVSWVGSSIASIILYYVAKKFSKMKFFTRYESNIKVVKIKSWIKKQGFNSIFISYACPFIPDFLITTTSGFAEFDIKTFISGMVCGKFIMFLLISYIGEDVGSLFSNPKKIVVFSIAILISWIVGQRVNNKIHKESIGKIKK
ncbi:MAG: TVP38/TMEM64 family protein [Romboutsia sp.]|uniref:TVP38/TMEM64 family protein n=1 Tax=Romboutsia sp. TaxID=1965302 RepID=UPI003F34A900